MRLTSNILRRARLAWAAVALAGAVALAAGAWAQSSVRPPGNAVNQPVDQGITAPLGDASDSDIWRFFKHGNRGTPDAFGDVAIPGQPGRAENTLRLFLDEVGGQTEARVTSTSGQARVMQVLGEEWRHIRRDWILPYAGWILLAILAALALFYIVRGRIPIQAGRSGRTIFRFSMSHRIAHWFLAATFILMSVSGLIILLGRPHLLPIFGHEATAAIVSAAMQGHNLFGPVFILSLLTMIVRFMRGNFFQWADLKWILKGGGLLGGHASSHHYNFGEKTWYWIVVFVGLMMSVTGLLLLFPWLTDVLAWHQLSTILHAGGAVLMIAMAMAHAYIGSIGMEGALDSMLRGEVDENWAREHHDLWYEEVTGKSAGHDADDDTPEQKEAPEGAT